MANFNGQLRSNEIYAALYNMIISQQVFADDIKGTNSKLADMFRVDGSLYGDQKLYYSTDVLQSYAWGNDAEAENLLELNRAEAPEVQAIVLDTFRQIRLTTDDYLSKRAWGNEGAFNSFNSVMMGKIRDTKRVYDSTLVNVYVGTTETSTGKQQLQITLPTVAGDAEAENRLQAQTIATELADTVVELEDVSRDFNDYGNMRSLAESDLIIVWNSAYKNKVLYMDLPTIFHKEGLMGNIQEVILPEKYFGRINAESGTTAAQNNSIYAAVEKVYGNTHLFPGELLPGNTEYLANETYTLDNTIIFKIMHKDSVPFMSAFEVATSFFNPRSLTENHYLTWGHNTLEYLKNYPFITVRGNVAGNKK